MKYLSIVFLALFFISNLKSQKKAITVDDMDIWNNVKNQIISDNGKWVAFEVNPRVGDGNLFIKNVNEKITEKIQRGYAPKFSPNSDFVVLKIKAQRDTIRKMKLDKVKKDKLPKDSLCIYVFKNKKYEKIEKLISFKLAKEKSSWFAYLHKEKKEDKSDTTETKKKSKKKTFDKKAPKTNSLTIYNPVENIKFDFKNVSEYKISRNGQLISFIKLQNDTILASKIFFFNTDNQKLDSINLGIGIAKKLTNDNSGKQCAFIHLPDTVKRKVYSLHLWKNNKDEKLIDTLTTQIPIDWTVSEHGKIYFSKNNSKLYFGISLKPEIEKKDTLLDQEKVQLDIWSWTDGLLQPQQLANLKDEKNRSYLTVYHINEKQIVQLEDETIKTVRTILDGNGNIAIGYHTDKYDLYTSWEWPRYRDVYLINIKTGKKQLFKEKTNNNLRLSNSGKYVIWFENADSSWYSYSIKDKKTISLTKNLNVGFYDSENDYPSYPEPYRYAGFTKDDKYVLIYDEYDIWKIDPSGKNAPENFTNGFGRKNKIRFRYVKLDEEEQFINADEDLLLNAFNKKTKDDGYYSKKLSSKSEPQKLVASNHMYS